MTATTATLPRGVTSTSRLTRVLRAMVVGLLPMLGAYWLIMVFLVVVAIVSTAVIGGGPIRNSMWDYGTQSPKYFSSAVGITLVPATLTLLIAQGITRRMFAVAASIFLVGAAACTATIWVLVYQLERGIYAWQGWSQVLENPHLFIRTSQAGLVCVEFFLMVLAHQASGWLISIGFYRFGFWKGLALLPIGLIPAAAAEFLLVVQWLAQAIENTGYHRPPLAVGIPGVLAVSALGLYFGYLLIRPFGLKPAKG
ncbi:hypothetical protein EV643_1066 [Kribbella sp. VKM Ac-2527]|uniref:Uncharacterized protein n=1 Tax=Kribbella caucasensis TaxID=2512215 RepID=A0A4V3CA53_9ACTN|nr:hypothetical protein [Kribbella sp. VKM Ac-2527]TDO49037.1 hypothetical protein EV643_1066 [Kribbella sp. VKM Ac-2527]